MPQNRIFYASVVFVDFVAFLLLKCCLSKSPYSDLHFDYPSFSHISYSLRVILDWKFFFEKKSTVSHLCPEFSFLETLEIFWKIPLIFPQNFHPGHSNGAFKIVPNVKKSRFQGRGWKGPKSLMTQKIDFFKVRDINTPIQPRKKKHQTNVSSALKTF